MSIRAFISFLFVLFAVSILNMGSVMAQKYTASSKNATASSPSGSQSGKCSIDDTKKIGKFDRKVRRYVAKSRKLADLAEESKDIDSPRESKKKARWNKKVMDFFLSEEYLQMKVVYERCGKKIPSMELPSAFWVPDEMFGDGGSCPGCSR